MVLKFIPELPIDTDTIGHRYCRMGGGFPIGYFYCVERAHLLCFYRVCYARPRSDS